MCALWKLGLWELGAVVVPAFCENHGHARGYSGAERRGRRGDGSVDTVVSAFFVSLFEVMF